MKIIAGLCLFGVLGSACGGNPQDGTLSALEPAAGDSTAYYRETPAGDYLASQFAQNRQDWKTAEHYLSRVIEHDPENTDLQRRAMILAMGAGETSRAIATARKIVQTDTKNDLALLIVTLDQFNRAQYKEAQQTVRQMQSGSIGKLIGPVLGLWASSANGEMDTSSLHNLSFHDYHAFLVADYLGQKDKLPGFAERVFSDLSVDYYMLDKVATTLARNGYKDKAAALYRAAGKQPDANPDTIAEKIAGLSKPGQLGKPMASPAQGAGEAFFDLARVMLREGSYESAKIFTRMSLHLAPESAEARLVLASLLVNDNMYDQAISYYRGIAKDSPLFADAQRQAAALLEEQGKRDEAIRILESLYEDHDDINALITIGDIYRNAEDYTAALDSYNRAAKAIGGKTIPEKYWGLLYVRGMAYERAGRLAESERDLKAAIAYRPDHPYLLNYLGYSWADQGKNLKEALNLLERAMTLEPEDGYITDSFGWALYKIKRYEEALPYLEKAVSLLPYDPEINDHLGDAYWQAGRKSEARFQWERAMNNSQDEALTTALQAKISGGLNEAGEPLIMEAAAPAATDGTQPPAMP